MRSHQSQSADLFFPTFLHLNKEYVVKFADELSHLSLRTTLKGQVHQKLLTLPLSDLCHAALRI